MKQDMYTYHYYRLRSLPPRDRAENALVGSVVALGITYSAVLLFSLIKGI